MLKFSRRREDIYQMNDFASLKEDGPTSLTGSISLQRSYGATRADLNYTDTKLMSHKVQASDTLQSLAIKYDVSVEKLKRINKIWSNESLFLKETIKIPYVAPVNKWEDDSDEDNDEENSKKDEDSNNTKTQINDSKSIDNAGNVTDDEEISQQEAELISETNCNNFLLNIDDRIKKCKKEWKKKEKQQSTKSQVPYVSYDSNDANKLSPTKQTASALEKL